MYNANNYGYNPYGNYMPQRQVPQPIQSIQPMPQIEQVRTGLQGKQVDSLEAVKATDVDLTGNVNYYPLTDGSAIVTKQLQMDGTSKMVIYKPVINETKEVPKYLVADDLDDLKEEISNIKEDLKELKKKNKKKDDDKNE